MEYVMGFVILWDIKEIEVKQEELSSFQLSSKYYKILQK